MIKSMPSVSMEPAFDRTEGRPVKVLGSPLKLPSAGLRRMLVQAADVDAPAAGLNTFVPKQAAITSPGVGDEIAPVTLML